VQSIISNWKSALLLPRDIANQSATCEEELLAIKVYEKYSQILQAYNACDFDDLIRLPVQLLQSNKELLSKWQQKVHYLLVDEYQDTNASQYLLIKLLMGERQTFTVVGDDDQSIYAWRGAVPENLKQLNTDFPTLKVIKLEQNYRSSGCILECANHLISHNPHLFEKKLWSGLGFGELVRVVRVLDEFSEARQVAAEIITHKLRQKTNFSDYAILYRGNHQSRLFEKALRDKTIPYQITGGQSFFSKSEIKDALAFLRLISNHSDDNAFLRVVNIPKRGIGLTTVEKLTSFAAENALDCFSACQTLAFQTLISEKIQQSLQAFCCMIEQAKATVESKEPLEDSLMKVLTEINYEHHLFESIDSADLAMKKMKNVRELMRWLGDLSSREDEPLSFQDVLQKVLLIDSLDRDQEEQSAKVQLMTLHASKGLEFPHVFLVGLEEELLPHKNSLQEGSIEEERRLAYVGITRAQKTLTMTLALRRSRYGEVCECVPSRFLEELPERCIVQSGLKKNDGEEKKASAAAHLSLLKSMLEKS
jgi:ATP-dependent DNA helicase Rep